MRRKGYLIGSFAAFGMLLLIIDSKTAIAGAVSGIDLCLKTVIPSLFPFFVLSGMLTSSMLGSKSKLLAPIGWLCGIPAGAESIFLTGLIGGYPLGAHTIANACRTGQLSPPDGQRMAAFCSNAGPAFIFGMAGAMFHASWIPWALWGIHISGAVFTAMILPRSGRGTVTVNKAAPMSPSAAVRSSISAMANVCGWVVLFRVVIAFLERWLLWLFPEVAQVLISGLLELANGCCALDRIPNSGLRFIICSGMLAMGGLCVAMQTASVCQGVRLRLYFPGKIVQSLFCVFLSTVVQYSVPEFDTASCSVDILVLSLLFLFFGAWILRKMQKTSSNLTPVGV